MARPHLTVVIPTRERADTLRYTLATCVEQAYPELTILVSDNASQDGTREVVEAFDDPRIRYVNTGRRVEMSENWEFALGHVEGGFVTYLGDDDALLCGASGLAADLLERTGTQALAWRKVQYCWPDHIVPELRNFLSVPFGTRAQVLDPLERLAALRRLEIGYDELPCVYNAFVRVELMRRVAARSGGCFFQCVSPDVYSGVALAPEVGRYVLSLAPLSVNGASRHSNGTASARADRDQAAHQKFRSELRRGHHPLVPLAGYASFCVADALLQARAHLPDGGEHYRVDMTLVAKSAAQQISALPPAGYAVGLENLRELGRRNGLEELVEKLIAALPNRPAESVALSHGLDPERSTLTLDASLVGIADVEKAALFSSYLLHRLDRAEFTKRFAERPALEPRARSLAAPAGALPSPVSPGDEATLGEFAPMDASAAELLTLPRRARDRWIVDRLRALPEGSALLHVCSGASVPEALLRRCTVRQVKLPPCRPLPAPGQLLPVGPEGVAAVLCSAPLERAPYPHLVLQELARVLAPGGQLLVVPDFADGGEDLCLGFTSAWYRSFCAEAGLDLVEMVPVCGPLARLGLETAAVAAMLEPRGAPPEVTRLFAEVLPRFYFGLEQGREAPGLAVAHLVRARKVAA